MEKAKDIKLVILDVDGVMTDGRIIIVDIVTHPAAPTYTRRGPARRSRCRARRRQDAR